MRPAGGEVKLLRSLSSEILMALLGSPQFCSGAASSVRISTLNVRSLNYTGAVTLLDSELRRWNIQIAGLQEVRWPLRRDKVWRLFLWSGRQDGSRREGVALVVPNRRMSTCVAWTLVMERLLHGRCKHSIGYLNVIVAYATTEAADQQDKDFYAQLDSCSGCVGGTT